MDRYIIEKSDVRCQVSGVCVRGFSLIELLLYTAVLAIVGAVMGGMFITISQSKAREEARTQVHSDIRFVFERIRQDLKEASEISSPLPGEMGSTLTIKVHEVDITYTVDENGQLTRDEGIGATVLTSGAVEVTNLDFTYTQNLNLTLLAVIPSLTVDMTVASASEKPEEQYSLSQQASFIVNQAVAWPARGEGSGSPGLCSCFQVSDFFVTTG